MRCLPASWRKIYWANSLTPVHWTKVVDSHSRPSGMAASIALPAVMRNCLTEATEIHQISPDSTVSFATTSVQSDAAILWKLKENLQFCLEQNSMKCWFVWVALNWQDNASSFFKFLCQWSTCVPEKKAEIWVFLYLLLSHVEQIAEVTDYYKRIRDTFCPASKLAFPQFLPSFNENRNHPSLRCSQQSVYFPC